MSRFANISGKQAAKAFEKAGWQAVGQVGSHLVLVKEGCRANLSIPQHRELASGTLRALIRAAPPPLHAIGTTLSFRTEPEGFRFSPAATSRASSERVASGISL